MFSQAPSYTEEEENKGNTVSASDALKPEVLEAVRFFNGSISGSSQAEIVAKLRLKVEAPSRRSICSALWKLVTRDKSLRYETTWDGDQYIRMYRLA